MLDSLHAFSELTKDDRLVVSAFKNIFDSYNIRPANSLVPIRVVGNNAPHRIGGGKTTRKIHLASWALP